VRRGSGAAAVTAAIVPAILCHGGAGQIAAERHAAVVAAVRRAAEVGRDRLAAGASALDVVVAVVRVLEDDPELNAGTGSVLTRDGTVEVDAAVMDGATRRIGAVAAVPDLADPIRLARAVLDDGEHVLLAGPAAWRFAREHGFEPAPAGALITPRARERWRDAHARRTQRAPDGSPGLAGIGTEAPASPSQGVERDGGTVGAVAIDRDGRLAAATSTGGITYKRSGRVGDSPVPGAGTWADTDAAISATGDGEHILRVALARGIAARAAAGQSPDAAIRAGLAELVTIAPTADAGAIAIDRGGRLAAATTTGSMPIGWAHGDALDAWIAPPDSWLR
jgi:L-asparaginase / beta-aspartyl-peptidase